MSNETYVADYYSNILRTNTINTITYSAAVVSDLEALEDSTTTLQFQVSNLEDDVQVLDQRVADLESSGGGGANVTGI